MKANSDVAEYFDVNESKFRSSRVFYEFQSNGEVSEHVSLNMKVT